MNILGEKNLNKRQLQEILQLIKISFNEKENSNKLCNYVNKDSFPFLLFKGSSSQNF